jgi:restriction system protein
VTDYYRVMPGRGSAHAQACLEGGFIGTDYGIHEDLTGKLPDNWRAFNDQYIPVFLANHPDKSKVAAGLACGAIWTVSKGAKQGDIVFSPDGEGCYLVGEIVQGYYYEDGGILPHRRPIRWLDLRIERSDMSEALQNSTGSAGTVCNISDYQEELEQLIGGRVTSAIVPTRDEVEDLQAFALETQLEEFLVENWAQTDLALDYDIFEDEGERLGKQYQTDAGRIDIFAISKDQKRLLVIELKKGRASDVVVGQILRYMGYVQEELAVEEQEVVGMIIAHEDDENIRWALKMVSNVEFYRYQVSFKLFKG